MLDGARLCPYNKCMPTTQPAPAEVSRIAAKLSWQQKSALRSAAKHGRNMNPDQRTSSALARRGLIEDFGLERITPLGRLVAAAL